MSAIISYCIDPVESVESLKPVSWRKITTSEVWLFKTICFAVIMSIPIWLALKTHDFWVLSVPEKHHTCMWPSSRPSPLLPLVPFLLFSQSLSLSLSLSPLILKLTLRGSLTLTIAADGFCPRPHQCLGCSILGSYQISVRAPVLRCAPG